MFRINRIQAGRVVVEVLRPHDTFGNVRHLKLEEIVFQCKNVPSLG